MAKAKRSQDLLASVFEQRAEHLSAKELRAWTAYTDRDRAIVQKLLGPGAKLVIGPRGSGKSTLLRTAYFDALDKKQCFPVYVNYAHSLALEPLFHRRADALQIFRQWLLCKVVIGAFQAFKECGVTPPGRLIELHQRSRSLVRTFESGAIPDLGDSLLTPQILSEALEEWCDEFGAGRCVILMDDAAHAFSPEQQHEFFEVFRAIRSRRVAGKAAVYPGITSYSPNFHAGHDAELIEVWSKPDTEFLASMREVVEKRLPDNLKAKLSSREEVLELLALASFGIPRGFLNMLSQVFGIDEGDNPQAPTRRRAEGAIADHADSVRALFSSLRAKLPRFINFVEAGTRLETSLANTLRKYNELQDAAAGRTNVIAIKEPVGAKFERVLNMLEYAGVVRAERRVSRGIKGRFRRYALHNAIVVAENVLALGKSYPAKALVLSLTSTTAHDFTRTTPAALLGRDFEDACVLNLPPCQKCGTPRSSEDQRFCMKCGAELGSASLYEELLRSKVEELPLPQRKLDGIREHTKLDTVQDVLLDDDKQDLLKVPYIGPVWANKIRTAAEEFVSV